MYMIGGTWRALAAYAMRYFDYPLTDPHGFSLAPEDAHRLAQELVAADPEQLMEISGISAMRAHYLPDAAALLRPLLDTIGPEELIFSSWGLREGLLDKGQEPEDNMMWVRLIATVLSVSLGSSLQFGFATGSLNNLEQVKYAFCITNRAQRSIETVFRRCAHTRTC